MNKILLLLHYSNKATLWSHWTLSSSEASPRIWTCVTRPSHAHVSRVWAQDYI